MGRGERLRGALLGGLGIGGLVALPLSLPILPPAQLVAYQSAIGLGPSASATEREKQGPLPQYFADMFGWSEMAEAVAKVYRELPQEDRAKAVFFARNYGEAAAVELYGRGLGPPVISAHNQYYLWGPRGFDGSLVITLGGDRSRLARLFGTVEEKGRIENAYAVGFETDILILLLRSPRAPLGELWPQLKHFN